MTERKTVKALAVDETIEWEGETAMSSETTAWPIGEMIPRPIPDDAQQVACMTPSPSGVFH